MNLFVKIIIFFLLYPNFIWSDSAQVELNRFYKLRQYSSCISYFEEHNRGNVLKEQSRYIYGECLYLRRKYKIASQVFLSLFDGEVSLRSRVANRVLDIIKLSFREVNLAAYTEKVLKYKDLNYILPQLQALFLSYGKYDLFLKLYENSPVMLNKQQWSIVISYFSFEVFQHIIDKASFSASQKKILVARYFLAHAQKQKAVAILDQLIPTKNVAAILLKCNILWHDKKNVEVVKYLKVLESLGYAGFREVAGFYFSHGDFKEALRTVYDGEKKGYNLYDLEIFYEMSSGALDKAAYHLEKYKKENKIASYRYFSLKKDYFRQGKKKDYWGGLKLLEKEFPEFCVAALKNQLHWDNDDNVYSRLSECQALKVKATFTSFIRFAVQEKKYNFVLKILNAKTLLNPHEEFLKGKSYCKKEKPEFLRCSEILVALLSVPNFKKNDELQYLLGLAKFQLKEYKEAEVYLSATDFADSQLLWLKTLVFRKQWAHLKTVIESGAIRKFNRELIYYKAIWSVSQKQLKQAEVLWEQYLLDSGIYGEEAVYYYFLSKYFKQNEKLSLFENILIRFPFGISKGDWDDFSDELKESEKSEWSSFVKYWYARYLLVIGEDTSAQLILTALLANPKANLLHQEINYILVKQSQKGARDFLLRFPDSPYNILIKQ